MNRDTFFGNGILVLLAAMTAGLIDAALVWERKFGAAGAVQYVPREIWAYSLFVWLAIGVLLAILAHLISRERGAAIAVSAMAALLVGIRMAVFTRKWAAAVTIVIFVALLFLLTRFRFRGPRRIGWWLAAMAIVSCGVALTAIRRDDPIPPAPARASGPNVVVIFLDTVRYDGIFAAGGTVKAELPSLRRLAEESRVFDAAWASSSWTLPSHLAAMTGAPAHRLGIDFDHQSIERPLPTLTERFRRNGYRTAAVASNIFLHSRSAFARGFDSYDHAVRSLDLCRTGPGVLLARMSPRFTGTVCGWPASRVVRRALTHMSEGPAPYFVVLNLMDAHDPSYIGPDCGEASPRRDPLQVHDRDAGIYGMAIRCIDRQLGALFERASASSRGTIIAVLSDHGEHFGERGLFGHGNSLYRELLHVPLIIRTPEGVPARIATPVSLTELPSLLTPGAVVTERPIAATLAFPAAYGGRREISAIRGDWQLITKGADAEELIDLRTGEEASPPSSSLLALLRADTAAVKKSWPLLRATDFRSLGYLR